MLDATLRPWLLEVNHAPSFACGSPLDEMVKLELIRNTMRLLHLYPYHKKTFKKEQQAEEKQLNGFKEMAKMLDQVKSQWAAQQKSIQQQQMQRMMFQKMLS